jgi:DNA-binding NarL/FixJ family response regulator
MHPVKKPAHRFSQARIRVLVVHRSALLAAGIAATLREHTEFELTAQSNADLASRTFQFDVVITDYQQGVGLMVVARTSVQPPGEYLPKVLLVSGRGPAADIRLALNAGILGYVSSDCRKEELLSAVRKVCRGERYLCGNAAQRVAESLTETSLSARENEVLLLVAQGFANKSIASTLEISTGTVKQHVKSLMRKLDVRTRTQAAMLASRRGLIPQARYEFGMMGVSDCGNPARFAGVRHLYS